MAAAGRADAAAEGFPARWIDVSAEPPAIHAALGAAMARHRYTPHETTPDGVTRFRLGSHGLAFLADTFDVGLIRRLMGRPEESFAQIAAWITPADGGHRLTVSLLDGVSHAKEVRSMLVELIETFRTDGVLVDASPLFSGLDLPLDSPGRPSTLHRKRAGTAPER
jgi:hypothetical protein